MDSVDILLNECSVVRKDYETGRAATGTGYNILQLVMEVNDELKQSALLASLLNPRGSHGQKGLFLDLFNKSLGLNDFDADRATLTTEKSIGQKTGDSGGRIDIFIESGNKQIIIENKRKAGDQERQLWRYHNAFNDATIVYLTPDGHAPDKNSYSPLPLERFHILSYRDDITHWLDQCQEAVADKPYLTECLHAYKILLNPDRTLMNNTAHTILNSEDNVKSAFGIADSIEIVKSDIKERLFVGLFDKLAKDETLTNLVFCMNEKLEEAPTADPKSRIKKACSPSNKTRPFGPRVTIGEYCGFDVHCGLFLNENIYFCMYVDPEHQAAVNKDFYADREKYRKDMFEGKTYSDEKNEKKQREQKNIVWKRPRIDGNEVINLYENKGFSSPHVAKFAAGDNSLIDEIYRQFKDFIQEAKDILASKHQL